MTETLGEILRRARGEATIEEVAFKYWGDRQGDGGFPAREIELGDVRLLRDHPSILRSYCAAGGYHLGRLICEVAACIGRDGDAWYLVSDIDPPDEIEVIIFNPGMPTHIHFGAQAVVGEHWQPIGKLPE